METNSTGIVVRRSRSYLVIWGKDHGYVFAALVPELKVQPADWVEYICFEDDDPPLEGVRNTALSCMETRPRAECKRGENNTLMCYTELTNLKSSGVFPPHGYYAMESEQLGVVFVPNDLASCIAEEGGKIECVVSLDVTSKERFPWSLEQIKRHGSYVKIRDVASTSSASVEVEPTSHREAAQDAVRPVSEVTPPVGAQKEEAPDAAVAAFPLERYVPDKTGSKKKVPAAILFEVSRDYGLIWNYNLGVVVVREEHLSSLPIGTWVSTRATKVSDPSLQFHYIATLPLSKINDLLILRANGTMVEVGVTMEPGQFNTVDIRGCPYIERRSELGPVYVSADRADERFITQHFKAWVTLVDYRWWIVQNDEDVVEVDRTGKPVAPETNAISPEPTFYDATETCEAAVNNSQSGIAQAHGEGDVAQWKSLSPASVTCEEEEKKRLLEQRYMKNVQDLATRLSEQFSIQSCEERILERQQASASSSGLNNSGKVRDINEEAGQEAGELKLNITDVTPSSKSSKEEMSMFAALKTVLSDEEVKQAIVTRGLEAELNYVLGNIEL